MEISASYQRSFADGKKQEVVSLITGLQFYFDN
jgi:hypothetical protein